MVINWAEVTLKDREFSHRCSECCHIPRHRSHSCAKQEPVEAIYNRRLGWQPLQYLSFDIHHREVCSFSPCKALRNGRDDPAAVAASVARPARVHAPEFDFSGLRSAPTTEQVTADQQKPSNNCRSRFISIQAFSHLSSGPTQI